MGNGGIAFRLFPDFLKATSHCSWFRNLLENLLLYLNEKGRNFTKFVVSLIYILEIGTLGSLTRSNRNPRRNAFNDPADPLLKI